MRRLLVLGFVALLTACGHDSSGPSRTPTITSLEVTSPTGLTPGRPVAVRYRIGFHDPDGDFVPGGLCRFRNTRTGQELDIELNTLSPGFPINLQDGFVSCILTDTHYQERVIPIELRIVDRAGHVSHPVESTLIIEARR